MGAKRAGVTLSAQAPNKATYLSLKSKMEREFGQFSKLLTISMSSLRHVGLKSTQKQDIFENQNIS